MKVYISASSNLEFRAAAKIVSDLGHEVHSSWLVPATGVKSPYREHSRHKLSSEQLGDLAEDALDELVKCDVLVSVFDARNENGDLRGSSGWAGFALARGIPVIAVGAFTDTILYYRRVIPTDWDSLPNVLTKVEKTFKMYFEAQRAPTKPQPAEGDTTDDPRTTPAGPSGPVRDERPTPGAEGGADGDPAPNG